MKQFENSFKTQTTLVYNSIKKYTANNSNLFYYWTGSFPFGLGVVEPDYFAGAGAGKKAPAPGCWCVALGYCGGKVATILINVSHFLTIYILYTQIEGKNRYLYTFKKSKLFSFQNCIFCLKLVFHIFVIRSRSW